MEFDVSQPVAFDIAVSAPPQIPVSTSPSLNPVGLLITPGPPGLPGPSGTTPQMNAVTAQPISGHSVVMLNDVGLMDYASADDLAGLWMPLGVTTGAWAAGVEATAQLAGIITEPSWNWVVGQPIWLGDSGLLTQTLPGDALFQRQVAEVLSPTSIFVVVSAGVILA